MGEDYYINKFSKNITLGNMLLTLNRCKDATRFVLGSATDSTMKLFEGTIKSFCALPENMLEFYCSMVVFNVRADIKNNAEIYYIIDIDTDEKENTEEKTETPKQSNDNNSKIDSHTTLKDYMDMVVDFIKEKRVTVLHEADLVNVLSMPLNKSHEVMEYMVRMRLLDKMNRSLYDGKFYINPVNKDTLALYNNYDEKYRTCIYCIKYEKDPSCRTKNGKDECICNMFYPQYRKILNDMTIKREPLLTDKTPKDKPDIAEYKDMESYEVLYEKLRNNPQFSSVSDILLSDFARFASMFGKIRTALSMEIYKEYLDKGTEFEGFINGDFLYIKSTTVGEFFPIKNARVEFMRRLRDMGVLITSTDRTLTCQMKKVNGRSLYRFDINALKEKCLITIKGYRYKDGTYEEITDSSKKEEKNVEPSKKENPKKKGLPVYQMAKESDDTIMNTFITLVVECGVHEVPVSLMKKTFNISKARANKLLKRLTGMGILKAPVGGQSSRSVDIEKCGKHYLLLNKLDKFCGFCTHYKPISNKTGKCESTGMFVDIKDSICESFIRDNNKVNNYMGFIEDEDDDEEDEE